MASVPARLCWSRRRRARFKGALNLFLAFADQLVDNMIESRGTPMPNDTPTPARAPQVKFVPDTRPLEGRSGRNPPFAAIVVMVAIIGLVAFAFAVEHWVPGFIRYNVPFGNSDYFWIGLIFLPMVALIVVAAATKLIELRQAKSWLPATGCILSAGIETRRHQFEGEPETVKNVPAVKYEFKVGGRTVDGTRISIGDEGALDIEATLKRYPAGADVTVYYDPRDPTKCVLERDFTQDLKDANLSKRDVLSGCLGGIAMLVALGIAIWGLVTYGPDFVRAHFPHLHAQAPMPIALICFGLVVLMFFFAARRTAKQAAAWPSVRGKIVKSAVDEYDERDSDGKWSTMYRPAVEFVYAVNGRELHGNQIKLGTTISAGKGYAAKVAAKYAVGSDVDVHYDPKQPTTAALENPTGMYWIILAAALICFALAAALLGVFG